MSAVETLREAARLMRERSAACPDSPWCAIEVGHQHPFDTDRDWMVDSPSRLVAGTIGGAQDATATALASHIAAWHPEVALAVADLLDNLAEVLPDLPDDDLDAGYYSAVAVARTYLGEQS